MTSYIVFIVVVLFCGQTHVDSAGFDEFFIEAKSYQPQNTHDGHQLYSNLPNSRYTRTILKNGR